MRYPPSYYWYCVFDVFLLSSFHFSSLMLGAGLGSRVLPYYCESQSVVNYGNNTRTYNKYLLNRYFIGFTAIYCPSTLLFECEGLGAGKCYCESQSVVNYGNNTRIYNKYLLNSILRQYIALTIHGFPALVGGVREFPASSAVFLFSLPGIDRVHYLNLTRPQYVYVA